MQAMGTKAVERKIERVQTLVTDQYCPASELTNLEKNFINLEPAA
jgi:hypothetical protein